MKRGIWGRALVGIAALCLVAGVATAAAKDSIVGNWDLDAAKSSVSGMASFKSGHVSVTSTKNGYKAVVDLVPATGAAVHYEYGATYDGTSAPVAGNTYFDSATVLRVDKNTTIRTERRGGKVVGMTTIEVAKDGKTFTSSSKGTLPDGKQFSRTLSWNRAKK
jgi:hypothetical protein